MRAFKAILGVMLAVPCICGASAPPVIWLQDCSRFIAGPHDVDRGPSPMSDEKLKCALVAPADDGHDAVAADTGSVIKVGLGTTESTATATGDNIYTQVLVGSDGAIIAPPNRLQAKSDRYFSEPESWSLVSLLIVFILFKFRRRRRMRPIGYRHDALLMVTQGILGERKPPMALEVPAFN